MTPITNPDPVGAVVFHQLMPGPGVVVQVSMSEHGVKVAKVLWQSLLEYGFHELSSLSTEPFTKEQK